MEMCIYLHNAEVGVFFLSMVKAFFIYQIYFLKNRTQTFQEEKLFNRSNFEQQLH